jgi:hypothetical protein
MAQKIARREIKSKNWEVIELDEGYYLKNNDYEEGQYGHEFYEQALIDKWVLRINTYPHY